MHFMSVYKLVQQGKLPAVKLGSRWKIDARQLHAWIAEHGPRAHDGEERLWLLVGSRGEGPSALESLAGSRHTVRTVSYGDLLGALAAAPQVVLLDAGADANLALAAHGLCRRHAPATPVILLVEEPAAPLVAEALAHGVVTLLALPVGEGHVAQLAALLGEG